MKLFILHIIISGITATMLMTLLVNFGGKGVNVIRLLGTLVLYRTTVRKKLDPAPSTFVTGTFLHYMIGILFAILYQIPLLKLTYVPGIFYSLVFGIVAGVVAMIAWKTFITFHVNPPAVPRRFFLLIFAGHIVLGMGIFFAMKLLALTDPETAPVAISCSPVI